LLTSCCASAACACFQVTSCVLLKVRVYLSCWAWSDFPTGGGAPGLFCLAASMSTFLLAIYSEATACMRQLMCTAVSQLRSDQLVPLHHHAHFIYPACLFSTYSYTLHVYFSYIVVGGIPTVLGHVHHCHWDGFGTGLGNALPTVGVHSPLANVTSIRKVDMQLT
jgi:hypothetical protein